MAATTERQRTATYRRALCVAAVAAVALLSAPAAASACPGDGGPAPASIKQHFCAAWDEANRRSPGALGSPLNDAHRWGNGWIRDFQGGTYGRGGIMEGDGLFFAYIVAGPYWDSYLRNNGALGLLGYPQGRHEFAGHMNPGPAANTYMTFQGGVINSWAGGTFASYGGILNRWNQSGNVSGPLGRPTSEEADTAVGPHFSTRGRFQRFENGVINFNRATNGSYVLFGGVLARYAQLGYSGSHLGLPVSEEVGWSNGGVRQNFEGGYIYWHPGDSAGHTNDDCPIPQPNGSAPQAVKDRMCSAWNAAGFPSLGRPLNGVHRWENGWIVDIDGGRYGRGAIMEGDGEGFAYIVAGPYWDAFLRAGGAGRLGYPTGRREFAGHLNDGPKGNRYMTFQRGVINSWSQGTFATYGAIRARWEVMGHVNGPLGLPLSDEADTARVPGRFQRFEGGNLIWDPATGKTWHVYGGILNKYAGLGYSDHPLGLPASDRQQGPRGNEYQVFQGGVINQYNGQAYETHGAILDRWNRGGGVTGSLGLAISDEGATARSPQGTVGRYSRFENGIINYNPKINKAVVLFGAIKDKYTAVGFAASYLGLPTSEEYGYQGGKRQDFEGGYIVWQSGWPAAKTDRELNPGDGRRDQLPPNADADGDAIPNGVESANLSIGADPRRKDIFVHADFMEGCKPPLGWESAAIDVFARKGIALHIDYGPDSLNGNREPWGTRSRAGVVPFRGNLGLWSELDALKNYWFNKTGRRRFFHYALFANRVRGDERIMGESRGLDAADFVITLCQRAELRNDARVTALTFVHELGHNLGLRHGGGDNINNKPNYLSIMNYAWGVGFRGVVRRGVSGRYPDYSDAEQGSVVESSLSEATVREPAAFFCPALEQPSFGISFGAVADLNCNGVRGDVLGRWDVNRDSLLDVLRGFNDWADVRFGGGGVIGALQAVPLPANEVVGDEPTVDEISTAGRVLARRGQLPPPQLGVRTSVRRLLPRRRAAVRVQVVANGRPVPAARVLVRGALSRRRGASNTDSAGRTIVRLVVRNRGRVVLTVTKKGYVAGKLALPVTKRRR